MRYFAAARQQLNSTKLQEIVLFCFIKDEVRSNEGKEMLQKYD